MCAACLFDSFGERGKQDELMRIFSKMPLRSKVAASQFRHRSFKHRRQTSTGLYHRLSSTIRSKYNAIVGVGVGVGGWRGKRNETDEFRRSGNFEIKFALNSLFDERQATIAV